MSVVVRLDDLLAAYEFINAGEVAALQCEAYISLKTGRIHWSGDDVEEELPTDIGDDGRYIAVPGKRDFDLGNRLALRFVAKSLPDSYDLVRDYFHSRGAYSRFKGLLERKGKLEEWYRYEQEAVEEALRDWCEENGLVLER